MLNKITSFLLSFILALICAQSSFALEAKAEFFDKKARCLGSYLWKWDDARQQCWQKNFQDYCEDSTNLKFFPEIAASVEVLKALSEKSSCEDVYAWLLQQNSLDLRGSRFTDGAPIVNLVQLQDLDLSQTDIGDVSSLVYLKDLKSLNLSYTKVKNIAALAALTNLQELDIRYTEIESLDPFPFLLRIKTVFFLPLEKSTKKQLRAKIASLEPIKNLVKENLKKEEVPVPKEEPKKEEPKIGASKKEEKSKEEPVKKHGGEGENRACKVPGMFALTFDDGPSDQYDMILDTLKENRALATFFVVGERLQTKRFADALKRADQEGHLVANHSWNHPMLTKLSDEQMKNQMEKTNNSVYQIIHKVPHYMRPPYGALNHHVIQELTDMNFRIVLWNIDPGDYIASHGSDYILQVFQRKLMNADPVTDSFISLQHDMHLHSAVDVPQIVKLIKSKGFRMVTVDECLGENDYLHMR